MILPFFRPKYFTFDRNFIRNQNWRKINESPLKRAGLLLRRIERGLIRKDTSRSQRPSRPGRPPKSRYPGHPFRQIYSVPDFFATNVVVGHIGFTRGQTPMEIHEFGQRIRIRQRVPYQRNPIQNPLQRRRVAELFRSGRIRSQRPRWRERTIKMPKRSFAAPTLDRGMRRLPQLWKNSVRSGVVN